MEASDNRLEELAVRYFDDSLTSDEHEELNQRLADSHEARAAFNDLILQAHTVAESPIERHVLEPVIWWREKRVTLFAAAASLTLLLGLGWWFHPKPTDQVPHAIARLEASKGSVDVAGAVLSGQTVSSIGVESVAVLDFNDGSRCVLAGDTALTVLENDEIGKQITLHSGHITVSAAPQPKDRPMILTTALARVEVLGTEFSLGTSPKATSLGVTEGRVRVVRLVDGKQVDVESDRYVVAALNHVFEPRPFPEVPDRLEMRFDDGLPSGWIAGEHRPASNTGPSRVATIPRSGQPRGTHHQIFTQHAWGEGMSGLFTIYDDTWLHFRYRMTKPGFYQIFLGTRNPAKPTSKTANFLGAGLANGETPGEWQTYSAKISSLKNLVGEFSPIGRQAIFLLFDTQEVDRGFEIERVWVTREPKPNGE